MIEHACANCVAPADCVVVRDVATPSQKHPFAFQALIAVQHATDPGEVMHGAKSFAFVVQCVPGVASADRASASATRPTRRNRILGGGEESPSALALATPRRAIAFGRPRPRPRRRDRG